MKTRIIIPPPPPMTGGMYRQSALLHWISRDLGIQWPTRILDMLQDEGVVEHYCGQGHHKACLEEVLVSTIEFVDAILAADAKLRLGNDD